MGPISFTSYNHRWASDSAILNPSCLGDDYTNQLFTGFEENSTYLEEIRVRLLNFPYVHLARCSLAATAKLTVNVANRLLAAPCGVVWNAGLSVYYFCRGSINEHFYEDQFQSWIDFEIASDALECLNSDLRVVIETYSVILAGLFIKKFLTIAYSLDHLPLSQLACLASGVLFSTLASIYLNPVALMGWFLGSYSHIGLFISNIENFSDYIN